jgi:hypothetical protein
MTCHPIPPVSCPSSFGMSWPGHLNRLGSTGDVINDVCRLVPFSVRDDGGVPYDLPGTTIIAAIHDRTLNHLPVPADATARLAAGRVLRVT